MTELLIPADLRQLAQVQAENEHTLLAMPNVVGVALGRKHTRGEDTGTACVSVLVDMKLDPALLGRDELIPAKLGSAPTDVVEVGVLSAGSSALAPPRTGDWTGEWSGVRRGEQHYPGGEPDSATAALQAMMSALAPSEQVAALRFASRAHAGLPAGAPHPLVAARIRPATGGLSVGHYHGTAGTLGICCQDALAEDGARTGASPRFYVLSNNHVLANCNDAAIGDPILQPAPADGGQQPGDVIARLSRFVPLRFTSAGRIPSDEQAVPVNYVDAAIAEGRFDQLDRRIHWIGEVPSANPTPEIGDRVGKSGRASGYTAGRIRAVNATVAVNYPGGRTARFAKQIVTDAALATGGDSGALAIDATGQRAIGLMFATSPTVCLLNPIPLVEHLLGVRIAGPDPAANGRYTSR
ncbi:serine protease [Amycolatopsis sp. NPDC059090]|uniref:serine protease n=1 Tax=Amycolatopsis sp. NPDC059090 TaxID=3346723 RepID=UPI003670D5D3